MKTASSSAEELYLKVLALNEDLLTVARLAMLARERVKYPLTDCDSFRCLADAGADSCDLGHLRLTMGQAVRYFPAALFPVANEDELIRKVLIALSWGRKCHRVEAQVCGDTIRMPDEPACAAPGGA